MALTGLQTILYVADQEASREFYAAVLGFGPSLDVPGMTEFSLVGGAVLGLMPERGIAALISPPLPPPSTGAGIQRCELYLRASDADDMYARALTVGARDISPMADRDWGERVAYAADLDGHVLAFAHASPSPSETRRIGAQ